MTIKVRPEDEQLIQERLESGAFATPEEVIHRALESLQADEEWLRSNRAVIHDKIERAFGQFESVHRRRTTSIALRAGHQ